MDILIIFITVPTFIQDISFWKFRANIRLPTFPPFRPSGKLKKAVSLSGRKSRLSSGLVNKELRVTSDQKGFEILYHFHWPDCPNGSLRLGHITLNPEFFDESSLFFLTHNGGDSAETFHLKNLPVNHLSPVSSLVSISQGVGLTSGLCEIGDAHHYLSIEIDKCLAALTGHVVYTPVDDRYFYRLVFSAMEMDDTSCETQARTCLEDRIIKLSIGSHGI